uniref:Para-hydroxybenzoate--polyprenyltransferase n=1 Tax=Ascaris suum TaxID=6253 RepID=F1LDD7_ASCSU
MLVLALGRCLRRCLVTAGLSLCRSGVYRISSSAAFRKDDASPVLKHAPMKFSAASVVELAPRTMQPYLRLMRVDKPAGTWLLYWPCTWSIALATPPGVLPSIYLLALFGAGSFFMRAAGCIINDIFDKKYDMKVERTRLRPLCSGELTNMDAIKLLSGLLSMSLLILLQLNWLSVAIGASSLLLAVAYPFAKRYTYWPQFVLGSSFCLFSICAHSAYASTSNAL